MDYPQSINVSYYILLLNKIIKGYGMRLDIMTRRNKVINDFIETFTKGDTIRGISDNAFNSKLVNSRKALFELKQLLRNDRRLIRFIRQEEGEEGTILGKAIEALDFAIELLNRKADSRTTVAIGRGAQERMTAATEQNQQLSVKKRLKKEKFNFGNFKSFCKDAGKLLHHVEKNMGEIEHRVGLEEIFLKNPNRDTLAIFVKEWREEVKKELELQQRIKIFIKKHKVKYEILNFPVPISVKFVIDVAKSAFPGVFVITPVTALGGEAAGLGAIIATLVVATGVAFREQSRLFDEIERTAEISSEKLIKSISAVERKHWWDSAFRI